MDDLILVEIDKRVDNLWQVIHDFHFSQTFSSFDKFIQSLIGTNLQQNINVFMVLKHMLELNDVRVTERLVNLNLSYKLNKHTHTFCLARERFKVLLAIILAAEILFVSRLVTS